MCVLDKGSAIPGPQTGCKGRSPQSTQVTLWLSVSSTCIFIPWGLVDGTMIRLLDCPSAEEGHATQLVSGVIERWDFALTGHAKDSGEGQNETGSHGTGIHTWVLFSECWRSQDCRVNIPFVDISVRGLRDTTWRRHGLGALTQENLVLCNPLIDVPTYWRSCAEHVLSKHMGSYAWMRMENAWMREWDAECESPRVRMPIGLVSDGQTWWFHRSAPELGLPWQCCWR